MGNEISAGLEPDAPHHQNDEDEDVTEMSSGWRVNLDHDLNVMPSTRTCYYCENKKGIHTL